MENIFTLFHTHRNYVCNSIDKAWLIFFRNSEEVKKIWWWKGNESWFKPLKSLLRATTRILSFLSEVKKFCKNGEISPASLIQPEISCLVPRWILNFLPRQKHASTCKNCIVENVDNKSRTPPPIQWISPSIANSIHSSMSSRDRFSVFLSLKKEKKTKEEEEESIKKKKREKEKSVSKLQTRFRTKFSPFN